MASLFQKKTWSQKDWDIYFKNLDMLRAERGLSKQELNQVVGVWNLYRKDMARPGERTLLKLCATFNVKPEWFSEPHDVPLKTDVVHGGERQEGDLFGRTKYHETPDGKLAVTTFEPRHAPPDPGAQPSKAELMAMAARVLDSGTLYETALASNVRAFHRAIQNDDRLAATERELVDVKNRLAQMETNLAALQGVMRKKGCDADPPPCGEESKKKEAM